MAGGYIIDPATGMPAVQTAGGVMLPLPLSDEELRAAGAQLGPGGPPAPAPDMRVAGPGGGSDLGPADPAMAQFIADQKQQEQVNALRQQLAPPPATNSHAAPPSRADELERLGQQQPGGPGGVDPSTLARRGGGGQAPQQQGEPGFDPLVQQAMAEAMRGGGGGGPRGLGQTGETRKLKTTQFAMDPEMAQRAEQAQLASQGYDEQLAMSLQQRHQQAYEAQQSEYAARAGQLQAQQARFERQQSMLQDYAAKRDAAIEEARQLKAPQMEEYWGSRSTLANVMTGLSIALGGALQGLRGGQNPGLEMSNQSIERWLQAKRADYENVKDSADRMDTQFGRMVQQFGSENQALEHMRLQAWEVRDGMLKSYAEKIGTPDALENYNQAMLKGEAEKAAAQARASQGAEVEIEQKLSMQGGGGGGRPKGVLDMARAGAEMTGLLNKIKGVEASTGGREVSPEKVNLVNSALSTVESSDEVLRLLGDMGASDSDFDDPLGGPIDSLRGLAGGKYRERRQRLEQSTQVLARNLQSSRKMGASDDDRKQADLMAGMDKSGQERRLAAETERGAALGALQTTLASLTPQQQRDLINQLRVKSPTRAAQVEAAIGAVGTPQIAASERPGL